MDKKGQNKSELILYQTEDGKTRLEVRLQDETVWLTQAGIAELYQTTPQNVTLHLKAISGKTAAELIYGEAQVGTKQVLVFSQGK